MMVARFYIVNFLGWAGSGEVSKHIERRGIARKGGARIMVMLFYEDNDRIL